MERGKEEKNPRKTRDAQCNWPPPAEQCPASSKQPSQQLPSVYVLSMMPLGMEYSFAWFESAVLTVLPLSLGRCPDYLTPSFSCTLSLAQETENSSS